MTGKIALPWREILKHGLIAGSVALLLSLIGIVATFNAKALIYGIFTMGQLMLLAPIALYVFVIVQSLREKPAALPALITSALMGLISGAELAILLVLIQTTNIRNMFVNASLELSGVISFGLAWPLSILSPLIFGALAGFLAAATLQLPVRLRNTAMQTFMWIILISLLRDLIITVFSRWGFVGQLLEWIFAISGLSIIGAIVLIALIGGIIYWRLGRQPAKIAKARPTQQDKTRRLILLAGTAVLFLFLPQILGIFFSEILDNVGIYIIMGLGLNIVVGYAGLLDLGYVAFYAIGAYTMGVLTSPELSANPLTFWQALPFAMGMSVLAGLILGLPVLRMRGDYLAIVTLGFGEIIRILVLSDWLRPWLGGAQGIQAIAQPKIGSYTLANQQQLYYLILVGIGIVAFIAWRIKDSRLGRSWMALREDEDVAQAMGINLVATKLTAFAMGALFSGLGGAIFAAKLTAAYPNSFNLLVSINVLCLIIVGGMGSIPGVFVGSLFLIGMPDLLREFAEFRYWVYGVVLVVMMLLKPEGLWPEERRKLELRADEEEIPIVEEDIPPVTGSAD
jgi:branched-chain amino acid transport system permease protein